MSSEYLRWKYRDVEKDPGPRTLTGKERFKNWFHYNKWILFVSAIALWIVGSMLWNILGLGEVDPDYVVAYIGAVELPEETSDCLADVMEALGDDVNDDGDVVVEIRQYLMGVKGDEWTAMNYDYSGQTKLVADITRGESYFFLMEKPQEVQLSFHMLANGDGTPPADDDYDTSGKVIRVGECLQLESLWDDPVLSDLYLGRRCFYGKDATGQGNNEALWNRLIQGTVL